MTMVERLREALADECDRQQDSRPIAQPWSELDMTALARAAVAAMREPTQGMEDVGATHVDDYIDDCLDTTGRGQFRKAWQAAIDAILNEKPKP